MPLCDSTSSGVKGPVDFTGYWALAKHEQMDEFLKAAGFPWVVRKAALKFGGSAVDVISHSGPLLRVTSLNAKGSWTRSYDVEREVVQRNAEGTLCKTTSWWEGSVFRSRMEGSELGVLESWRFMRGNSMAVRTALRTARGGPEAVMFWFFDRMETLQRHVARGSMGRRSLRQQIEADQRRVEKATRDDTAYIQSVLLDWQRWRSPADDFIHVISPPPMSRPSRVRRRSPGPGSAAAGSPRTMSPLSMSKSPSNDSLSALPAGVEMRSEAKSIRSELSRSRLAESELSNNALDRMARQAAALALAPDGEATSPQAPSGHAVASPPAGPGSSRLGPGFAAQQQQQVAPPSAAHVEAQHGQHAQQGQQSKEFARELTLTYPRSPDGAIPVEPSAASSGAQQGPPATDSLTFRPSTGGSPRLEGDGLAPHGNAPQHAPYPPAPDSDVATRGSLHSAPQHHRSGSAGSAGAVRAAHYKSLSADSTRRGGSTVSGRASPRSTPATSHHLHLTPAEQLMNQRLHEFGDSRGIMAVVPVSTPNDTAEPQLLSMSPEQAEETAAKLRELEADMLLRRQENRRGWSCCGCFVLTWAGDTLPDHLRVWEMTID